MNADRRRTTSAQQRIGASADLPEGLLGSLIAELFVDAIVDTVLWSTGALVLKAIRPHRPVNQIAAVLLGLTVWLAGISALITIGYFLLV